MTATRINTHSYILDLINNNVDDIKVAMDTLKHNIGLSQSSRRITYKQINPNLSVHKIYLMKHNINEHHRTAFTRFRLSSHSLAVEVGRWSRRGRGRLPLEERLCTCGEIQTEQHVVQYCPMSQ